MPGLFLQRSYQEEIMDDLNCSGEVVNQTLRELDTINSLLGGNSATLTGVGQFIRNTDSTIKLVDLGCGSGKMLQLMSEKFNSKKIEYVGVDANPNIIAFANANNTNKRIQFQAENILSNGFAHQQFDIAVATLFLHHFTNEQLVHIFKSLSNQCRVGIVVNDLHRHWFAYYSIKVLTRIFSRSSMVKFDAPVSVLRGFVKQELVGILHEAGIKNYSIRWKWAFRWQVVIRL